MKGSFRTPLLGEGLSLGASFPDSLLLGLPRRIGVISGTTIFSFTTGAMYAPTRGGETIWGGDVGRGLFRRVSECVAAPYIWDD
jgi:hypothetical protein